MELYDINGQKLFYQYSVYKNNNLIGRIDVFANKKLGASVNDIEFDPKPFKASEAMKKSIEIAKSKYPAGEVKSTKMVVYNYPNIGAMTVVKDKTTGDKYRVFVDAYTLDVVPDKPATLTEPGVWSMYEHSSKNGIDKNLKEWQKSDQLTKFVEQEAVTMGINASAPITEENMNKLSGDVGILLGSSRHLLLFPNMDKKIAFTVVVQVVK
jgi:hypothetical protein